MRRLLALVALAAAAWFGVGALADLTQTRPEAIDPASRAAVDIDVAVHGFLGPIDDAARSLWAVCMPQLGGATQLVEAVSVSDGRLTAVVAPAPGDHARMRLRGCLNDVTLDRVKGHLVAVTPLGPGGTG